MPYEVCEKQDYLKDLHLNVQQNHKAVLSINSISQDDGREMRPKLEPLKRSTNENWGGGGGGGASTAVILGRWGTEIWVKTTERTPKDSRLRFRQHKLLIMNLKGYMIKLKFASSTSTGFCVNFGLYKATQFEALSDQLRSRSQKGRKSSKKWKKD